MNDYPSMIAPVGHIEPVPRRIRAYLAGEPVLDTTRTLHVWEKPYYPQYYIPLADVRPDVLIDEQREVRTPRGQARLHGVRVTDVHRTGVARLLTLPANDGPAELTGTVRFEWAALDSWFEEDEQVSCTRAAPTSGSTHSAPPGRCASRWTGRCWPSPAHRCWYPRPGCRPATISAGPR